ncbi:MAG TPA: hypothetical protein VK395_19945 [Gemmataceae bacterium]|nr:hypothetical protein [Gemmataceae bacterium]
MLLEVTESGDLLLPAALIQAPPRTRLEAERQGEAVIVKPAPEPGAGRPSILSLPTFPAGPIDPNRSFRREEIYGDDGR